MVEYPLSLDCVVRVVAMTFPAILHVPAMRHSQGESRDFKRLDAQCSRDL